MRDARTVTNQLSASSHFVSGQLFPVQSSMNQVQSTSVDCYECLLSACSTVGTVTHSSASRPCYGSLDLAFLVGFLNSSAFLSSASFVSYK